MILLIDNYDSFTYNLAQLVAKYEEVKILRNDDPEVFDTAKAAAAIIFSPGPGTPKETGLVSEIIQRFYQSKPMLGICLGHQTLAEVFGGEIVLAKNIRHGKESLVTHNASCLFAGIDKEFPVIRYHSLVIKEDKLTTDFMVTAVATDDHEIMAIQHKRYPIFGLQFHPESIGTPDGEKMIQNFMTVVEGN